MYQPGSQGNETNDVLKGLHDLITALRTIFARPDRGIEGTHCKDSTAETIRLQAFPEFTAALFWSFPAAIMWRHLDLDRTELRSRG